jgi:hypothetical protein
MLMILDIKYPHGSSEMWLWHGNVDSIGHLCVQDARLPCQDTCVESMTHHGLWPMTPIITPPLRIHDSNDQVTDIPHKLQIFNIT